MNKKGFTVIELITSFSLSAIIIILLFNIVLNIKNIYSTSAIKTEMLIKQATLSRKMNNIITGNNIKSYSECSQENYEICYEFDHIDGNKYYLLINKTNGTISFNNYIYKLDSNSYIENVILDEESIDNVIGDNNNSLLYIKIYIYNKGLGKENYGINLVYPYNSNNFNI